MPKEKLSITVDRGKIDRARELVEARSVSDLIDVALTRLIQDELERRHVDGYVSAAAWSRGTGMGRSDTGLARSRR